MTGQRPGSGTDTVSEDDVKVEKPKLYQVILLNDNYTTMDFVVSILETVFKKSPAEAARIMLLVHNRGRGVCGVYVKQVAEAKMEIVHSRARSQGYPLRCIIEEV